MSSEAEKKSPLADPLLILIALLLVVAAGATLYFIPAGASKSYAIEPGARPRPVITNQVVMLNVQEVAAAAPAGHSSGHATPAPSAPTPAPAPAAAPAAEAAPAAPAAAAASLSAPAVTATADGKVRGRVILKGTPPADKPIGAVKTDANCGKVAHGNAITRNYVVGAEGGLRYTLARIVKAPAGAGKAADSVLVDQAGCMYEPYISAMLVGKTIKFQNSDPFMHNINATPKVSGNKPFNISQASQGQVNDKVFDVPELAIRFVCNVHPWMIAFVHVLENPFFAITNDQGEFELPDGLPPGKYELEVIHPKAGTAKQEIEIAAGKGTSVVFELAPGAVK
ncbi:MAG: hypothetical protein RIS76_3838 [Verrucomicrobiota bacterium]|jgi:plastocyanin